MWLLTSPLGRYLLAGLAAVLIVGGAGWWIYHKGQTDERNATAGKVLQKTETDRKDREKNDEKARSLDDQRALECLRNPTGCR